MLQKGLICSNNSPSIKSDLFIVMATRINDIFSPNSTVRIVSLPYPVYKSYVLLLLH